MPFELTEEGLTIQTVIEIQDEIAAEFRAEVDPLINTDPDSLDGQEIGIYSSHEREVQEVVQVLVDSIDPDNAEGERLDVVGSLRGIPRKPATKSTFKGTRKVTMRVAASTTIPAGQIAAVPLYETTTRFVSLGDAVNASGVEADVLVEFESESTGPVHANANTLTRIVTPYTGWVSVNNDTDPLLGTEIETDGAYHDRQEQELAKPGTGTINAIRAEILALENDDGTFPVLDAFIIENTTDATLNGVPPHAFEAVVWDGSGADAANADIAQVIFENKPAGIGTSGSVSVSVADSYGVLHVINFSRPTQRPVKMKVELLMDPDTYVGDDAVATTEADGFQGIRPTNVGNRLRVGQRPSQDVAFSPYMALAQLAGGVTEIIDFQTAFVGDAFASYTDLVVGLREIATLDTSDITILSEEDPGA